MKNRIYLFIPVIFLFILNSCMPKTEPVALLISNESDKELTDKAVIIKRTELKNDPGKLLPLITNVKGDTIPSQVDDLNNDGTWDEIFFVISFSPRARLNFTIDWVTEQPVFIKRTSVRFGKRDSKNDPVTPRIMDTLMANEVHKALGYQPYQTDGPSWENDKVGFRHYFDGRNSKDLFGKKVSYMSPDSVGINLYGAVEDNYHVMHDWGRDILAVGNAAGIGGFEMMIGDSITRLGITNQDTLNNIDRSVFKIIKEGPVRSVVNFDYHNWHVNDRLYDANETVMVVPGIYGYQSNVKISGIKGDETLLVGLVNSNTDKELTELTLNDHVILYTHDKQTYDKVWYLGLALILPKNSYQGYGEAPEEGSFSKSFYGKLAIQNNQPVTYYSVACWEIADSNFINEEYFRNYVVDLAEQLSAEISVMIE